MTTIERMFMYLLVTILFILGFTLGNHYRHSYVYRPTEIEAFRNIEREQKIIKEWGFSPHYTNFERKIYYLDLEIRSKIIPNALQHNKSAPNHASEVKVPISIYEIAKLTNHTPDYIQRVMETIDNKVWLRQRLNLYPYLPVVDGIKIEKV